MENQGVGLPEPIDGVTLIDRLSGGHKCEVKARSNRNCNSRGRGQGMLDRGGGADAVDGISSIDRLRCRRKRQRTARFKLGCTSRGCGGATQVLASSNRLLREQEESHDNKREDKMRSLYYQRAPPSVRAE